MNASKRFLAFALALSLGSPLAVTAAPRQDDQGPQHGQQQQGPKRDQGGQQGPGHAPQQPASPNRQGGGQPPSDFNQARQQIQQHRQEIGRGNPPPPNVRIARGQPLPHGYGKRLPRDTLAKLPHYQGYEWRRVGSDMVLVALATGIVHTILTGVLD